MRPRLICGLLATVACLGLASAAQAQTLVYDPSAYAKLLEQAQTTLRQLDQLKAQVAQAQRLYDGFNQASGVNRIAQALAAPELREVLPDAAAFAAAAHGDLAALGKIGALASDIRGAGASYAPAPHDPAGSALAQAGDRAARDLALGETVMSAGAERLKGLQALQGALDTAPNARAVMDLQARLSAEQAMIANDQTRLQGIAMAQAAEARLAQARDQQAARAASDARLQLYRSSFP